MLNNEKVFQALFSPANPPTNVDNYGVSPTVTRVATGHYRLTFETGVTYAPTQILPKGTFYGPAASGDALVRFDRIAGNTTIDVLIFVAGALADPEGVVVVEGFLKSLKST